MENKRIVYIAPKTVVLRTEDTPGPKANEVMVRLAVSTISSGTERANLLGTECCSTGSLEPGVTYPVHHGYSSAGVVVEVGSEITKFKVGDRVSLSWSTHSQFVCAKEENVHLIEDDNVSFSNAALVHIATFPLAAIRKCHLEFGETAMVMGLGVLGLVSVKLLRLCGANPIIAVDPVASKRELALKYGADYALDPYAPDFAETARKLSNGGVQVAIEVTGVGQGLNGALDCMRKMGRVALLGCTRRADFTVNYYQKVHGPGITLYGAHTMARPTHESSNGLWTTHDDAMALLRMISAGRLDLAGMVEETHAPCEAPEVYTRLAEDKFFPIVQFDWSRL